MTTETIYKEAIAEIDSILQILEAEIPANPQSLKHQRERKRLEKLAADYFKKLEQSFPYFLLGKLYNKYVEKE